MSFHRIASAVLVLAMPLAAGSIDSWVAQVDKAKREAMTTELNEALKSVAVDRGKAVEQARNAVKGNDYEVLAPVLVSLLTKAADAEQGVLVEVLYLNTAVLRTSLDAKGQGELKAAVVQGVTPCLGGTDFKQRLYAASVVNALAQPGVDLNSGKEIPVPGALKSPAVAAFQKGLKDPNPQVRKVCAVGLCRLQEGPEKRMKEEAVWEHLSEHFETTNTGWKDMTPDEEKKIRATIKVTTTTVKGVMILAIDCPDHGKSESFWEKMDGEWTESLSDPRQK